NPTATSVGLSISRNIIHNNVESYAQDIPLLSTTNGDLTIESHSTATIDATASTTAFSAALSFGKSTAFAGGGAVAVNTITGSTTALLEVATANILNTDANND